MKCLPSSKIPLANGTTLHDWHAEILALRSFNRYLLDECLNSLKPPFPAPQFLDRRPEQSSLETGSQPFQLKDDVQIHMYCSEAPCGDASMELIMDAQEDASPWTSPAPTIFSSSSQTNGSTAISAEEDSSAPFALRGRSHFGHLGAVRLKPSRPDAPPTLSKSCTDKLALTQCTSLLSSLTSLLIAPRNAYLSSLILPQSQHVENACTRAFSRSGRMSALTPSLEGGLPEGYAFRPFEVKPTSVEFKHSRRSVRTSEKAIPCNLSAMCTPHTQESLIGGVLQGRKQLDPRGASSVCRNSMWRAALEIAGLVGVPLLVEILRQRSYGDVKNHEVLAARNAVKHVVKTQVLKGWVKNPGDEDFGLDNMAG
jgi:tRNA-specific adenosine deaminase 1